MKLMASAAETSAAVTVVVTLLYQYCGMFSYELNEVLLSTKSFSRRSSMSVVSFELNLNMSLNRGLNHPLYV